MYPSKPSKPSNPAKYLGDSYSFEPDDMALGDFPESDFGPNELFPPVKQPLNFRYPETYTEAISDNDRIIPLINLLQSPVNVRQTIDFIRDLTPEDKERALKLLKEERETPTFNLNREHVNIALRELTDEPHPPYDEIYLKQRGDFAKNIYKIIRDSNTNKNTLIEYIYINTHRIHSNNVNILNSIIYLLEVYKKDHIDMENQNDNKKMIHKLQFSIDLCIYILYHFDFPLNIIMRRFSDKIYGGRLRSKRRKTKKQTSRRTK